MAGAVKPQLPLLQPVVDSRLKATVPWSFYWTWLDKEVLNISLGGVVSFNARTGDVVLSSTDVVSALGFNPAPLDSPIFINDPQAPTAPIGTNTNQLATTAFVLANAPPAVGLAGALTCSYLFS